MIIHLVKAPPRPLSDEDAKIRRKNFLSVRRAQIAQARAATPITPAPTFIPGFHLPSLPSGYAAFRNSPAWKAFEEQFRRKSGSICHDCHKFQRCEIHHTNTANIHALDPADIILVCPTCRDKRIQLKPPIVHLPPEIRKRDLRRPTVSSSQLTENKEKK